MNRRHYSSERNVQILVSLLKQYGIRQVVASPGTTNVAFVGSIQQDSFFKIYSSVDEPLCRIYGLWLSTPKW